MLNEQKTITGYNEIIFNIFILSVLQIEERDT